MEARLLTVDEFARDARVSRTTVFRLIKSGAIPSLTVGRARRIPATVLDPQPASQRAES